MFDENSRFDSICEKLRDLAKEESNVQITEKVFKGDVNRVKNYLRLQLKEVEIVRIKNISNSKVLVTFQKM